MMGRVEDDYEDLSRASVYCIKHSVMDSRGDEDYGVMKVSRVGVARAALPTGNALIFEYE